MTDDDSKRRRAPAPDTQGRAEASPDPFAARPRLVPGVVSVFVISIIVYARPWCCPVMPRPRSSASRPRRNGSRVCATSFTWISHRSAAI